MFGSINPKYEELRAQRTINALTDQNKAADIFAPARSQAEPAYTQVEVVEPVVNASRNNGQGIRRFREALKLNQQRLSDETV